MLVVFVQEEKLAMKEMKQADDSTLKKAEEEVQLKGEEDARKCEKEGV